MIRGVLVVLALGAAVLAPVSLAQDEKLEGLQQTGMENPKGEPGDLVLRLGFTFARADVPEYVRRRLDAVAAELANERASAKVEIAGHTDGAGPEEFNQMLSEKRAAAVRDYLVQHGVAAERISIVGYGESQPRDTNDTVEGRRKNRRVEIRALG